MPQAEAPEPAREGEDDHGEERPPAASVCQSSRDVTASRRHGDRERDRNEEGHAEAQPARVDADREAARLEDAVEELGDVIHMRTTQNAPVAITSQKQ